MQVMAFTANPTDAVNIAAAQGGLDALLAAQSAHPENEGINEQFCGALCNLVFANSANANFIVEQGGLAALLAAQRSLRIRPLFPQTLPDGS